MSKLNPEAPQWPWLPAPASDRSPISASVTISVSPKALFVANEKSQTPRTPTPKRYQGSSKNTTASSSAVVSNADSGPIVEKRRVYIGNIHYDATRRQIHMVLCSKSVNRTLQKLYIPFNGRHGNKGFAFATYADPCEAKHAMRRISGTYLMGRRLVCLPCLPKGVHGVDRRGWPWGKRRGSSTFTRQDLIFGSPFQYIPEYQPGPLWTDHCNYPYTAPYFGNEPVFIEDTRYVPSQHYRNDSGYVSPTPKTGSSWITHSGLSYTVKPFFNGGALFRTQFEEQNGFLGTQYPRPDLSNSIFLPSLDYAETELPTQPTPIYRPPRDSFAAGARTLKVSNLPPMPTHPALESEMNKLFKGYVITSVSEQLYQYRSPLDIVKPPTAWCPDTDHPCEPHSCFIQFVDSRHARDAARDFQGKQVWHGGRPRRLRVEREWSFEM